jgi:methyl-accepting chemotaxis protein
MADGSSGFLSQSSVRGKLMHDFLIAVFVPTFLVGVLVVLLFSVSMNSQADRAAKEIDSQGQSRVAEHSKVLSNLLQQSLSRTESQTATFIMQADFQQTLAELQNPKRKPGTEAALRDKLHAQFSQAMNKMELSLLTLVGKDGKVIMRATDPEKFGDDTYHQDYPKATKIVAPLGKLIDNAVQGKVTTSFEPYPAEVLATEKVIDANIISAVTKIGNTLADQARIQLTEPIGSPVTTGAVTETRGLMLSTVQPVVSSGKDIMGVIIAARMINRNPKIGLRDYANLITEDISKASVTLDEARVLTAEKTSNDANALGYKIPDTDWQNVINIGSTFSKGNSTGVTPSAYAQYTVIRNSIGKSIGSTLVATDYDYYDRITSEQKRSTTSLVIYAVLILLSILTVGFLIALFLAKRRSGKIILATNELKSLAESIVAGDFNARVNITTGDEFEELSIRFNEMTRRLSALIETESERDAMQKQLTDLLIVVSNSAEGDFTQRATVTEGALGALADSFNLMVDDLGNLIREVQSVAEEVQGSAGDILNSTEQTAQGAEEQSVQVANASAAVEEMAASIRQVAMNADSAADAAQRAASVAQSGGSTVRETIDGMKRIRSTVSDSAQKIKSLGESSLEISKIVQVIEDIANQTNLLALNATIEAARAGEAGRGFSVVANQVRELAERSSKATNDISQLVQTIQSETQEAVSAMERGTLEVERGTKLADTASRALDEIQSVVQQSTELIQEISLAAKQQDIASAGVVSAMNEVSQIAKQSLVGSKQSAAAATKLAEITTQLAGSVSRFKIAAGAVGAGKDDSLVPPPPSTDTLFKDNSSKAKPNGNGAEDMDFGDVNDYMKVN